MLPAAAGDTAAKEDLLKGRKIGDMTYKVHLDGYDLGPALKGQGAWPRKEFIYWTDDGSVAALRYDNWKITFRDRITWVSRCGRSRSRPYVRPRSPTCAWIPSNAPRRSTRRAISAGT